MTSKSELQHPDNFPGFVPLSQITLLAFYARSSQNKLQEINQSEGLPFLGDNDTSMFSLNII